MNRRWLVLCLSASFLFYLAFVPRILLYSNPPTGDQAFYLMDADSIVHDGDLNVANEYANYDFDKFYRLAPHPPGFVGISAPYPLPAELADTPNRPRSEQYSHHLPGMGLSLAPAWLVGSWFSLWWPATMVFMCLVAALLALNIFLLSYEAAGRLFIAWAVWASMALCSPIFSYAPLIFSELPCGLLLIYAFRRLALGWRANGPIRRVLIGLCVAYIPWLALRCSLISIGLCLYAGVQWWRAEKHRSGESKVQANRVWGRARHVIADGAGVALPIILSFLAMVWFSLYLFGKPYPSGAMTDPLHAPFHWPWLGGHDLTLFVTGAFALVFDRQWGLLPFTPVYLLAVVGMTVMVRSGRHSDRRFLLWVGVVAIPNLFLISSFEFWGGLWCPPARYLSTLTPLLAAPLAISLSIRNIAYRILYGFLTAIGFGLMAVMLHDPRLMFPIVRASLLTWLASDPASPVHVDLRGFIPAFAWPDLVAQPVMTARIVAVAFILVLFCALILAPKGSGMRSHSWTSGIMRPGWIFGASVLLAGWYAMNREFLQHTTVLQQQQRWELRPSLQQPRGAAYVYGRLFLTDYDGRSLGMLIVGTGTYQTISLRSSRGPVKYGHPGDVKLGPHHLLYLLNNGRGREALYVLRPDGHVLREQRLAGKGPISLGLAFDSRGFTYVSDMSSSVTWKYHPGGSVPLGSSGGKTGRFDNVGGIAVDPSTGAIFAAEMTTNSVQELDASGRFVRAYDLACSPQQLVEHGDWIDATCGSGLISIDVKSGTVQQSRLGADDPPLVSPPGLAYGPGHILYVVDGSTVIAYRIDH
jgi:hypothetical protein